MKRPAASAGLSQLARSLRDGSVHAVDLVESCMVAFARGRREAFKTWDPDGARCTATLADAAFARGDDRGLLQGIPWSAKDLYGAGTLPVFAGSPRELPAAYRRAGPLAQRFVQSLAPLMGKTHTVEFAFGGLGVNTHWGTPHNAAATHTHRVPGGSSAGAAVSLSEGSSLLALATDTAGSVRIPASWHGLAGLKTTAGRWSTAGIVPLSSTLDSAGILARSVADLSFAFAALDPSPGPIVVPDRSLTLGILDGFFWDDCSPGVVSCVQGALTRLEHAGFRTRAVTLPEADDANHLFLEGGPAAAELGRFLESELADWRATLDPVVAPRVLAAKDIDDAELARRRQAITTISRAADLRIAALGVDLLVSPTVAITPPKLAEVSAPATYRRANLLALRNTAPVNYLGLCALTLPVGKDTADMPVGLQLIARAGEEEGLLAMGMRVEKALALA